MPAARGDRRSGPGGGGVALIERVACCETAPRLRIQILHVPDCPLLARLRTEVERGISATGTRAVIEELEGPYPSPTLLIDRVDVTGRTPGPDPMCRLDLPTHEEIVRAIRAASRDDPGAVPRRSP